MKVLLALSWIRQEEHVVRIASHPVALREFRTHGLEDTLISRETSFLSSTERPVSRAKPMVAVAKVHSNSRGCRVAS
eukprot:scaffold7627_cov277-Pinguiococcus_pyrenoidosus.AAC.2